MIKQLLTDAKAKATTTCNVMEDKQNISASMESNVQTCMNAFQSLGSPQLNSYNPSGRANPIFPVNQMGKNGSQSVSRLGFTSDEEDRNVKSDVTVNPTRAFGFADKNCYPRLARLCGP